MAANAEEDLKTPDLTLLTWVANYDVRKKMSYLTTTSMQEYMSGDDSLKYYNYGELNGEKEFQVALSEFIEKHEGIKIPSKQLFPTYGSTYGFMLIMTHFFEANDTFFVEDLTFGAVATTAKDFGMNVVSVSCDEEGIQLEELEKKILKAKSTNTHQSQDKKPYWGLIYALTVLHNPKGMSYSPERCRGLIKLARKYDLLVIVDDVYDVFQYYDDCKATKLLRYDDSKDEDYGKGHVVSNCSLSKILFPSSRIGWIETSDWILNQLQSRVDLFAGGGYNPFMQILIAKILKNPSFPDIFKEIKESYKKQLEFSCDYLNKNLSSKVTFEKPKGSFFLWLELPKNLDASELRRRCKQQGIDFIDGAFFTTCEDKAKYKNCFRICVTNYVDLEVEKALKILCSETNKYIEENTM